MEYTVYLRTNLINGKQYVGQTKNIRTRENNWRCIKARYANKILTEEREKYGANNFKMDILAECETQEEAWELEQRYIAELGTRFPAGYNMCNGGKTSEGTIFTEETKKKLSEVHKGMHNSPATEFKKGITPWMKGKHHTEESNEKNRQAHLGKISKKRIPVVQLDLDGNLIREYTHCADAAKEMGFKSDESIRRACKKTWRKSGGYKWMYKDDYEALKQMPEN